MVPYHIGYFQIHLEIQSPQYRWWFWKTYRTCFVGFSFTQHRTIISQSENVILAMLLNYGYFNRGHKVIDFDSCVSCPRFKPHLLATQHSDTPKWRASLPKILHDTLRYMKVEIMLTLLLLPLLLSTICSNVRKRLFLDIYLSILIICELSPTQSRNQCIKISNIDFSRQLVRIEQTILWRLIWIHPLSKFV